MLSATGSADPDEVWDRYARPGRWPEWSPQIRSVETDAERIAAGVSGTVVGPGPLRVHFAIRAVDEGARTWTWVVRFGLLPVEMTHAVRPGSEGSATTLDLSGPALAQPLLLAYAPVAQLALRRLVRSGR